MNNVYYGNPEDFIFTENTKYDNEQITSAELNKFGVIECVDSPDVACYRIALENEQNFNNIMNAFMVKEFKILESAGIVTEAENKGKVKKFFELIRSAIERFWSKIMGVFKKVRDNISLYINKDKDLIHKLKLVKKIESDEIIKGYTFEKLDEIPEVYKACADIVSRSMPDISVAVKSGQATVKSSDDGTYVSHGASTYKTAYKLKYDNMIENVKAALCNKYYFNEKTDIFAEEVKNSCFGKETEFSVKGLNIQNIISEIEGAKKAIKQTTDSYNASKFCINDLLKEVKKMEKVVDDFTSKNKPIDPNIFLHKSINDFSSAINKVLSLMGQTLSTHTSAILAQLQQNRKFARAILSTSTSKSN